jgi:hypothetical protein
MEGRMMNWTARLAERRAASPERLSCALTKPTKPPFGSFVSEPGGHSDNPSASSGITTRDRLLALAAVDCRDLTLVQALPASFLHACGDMREDALRALLSMLADDAERKAGRVPAGDTATILCERCGPVFLNPAIARVLPQVGGWPRALGCPWCFIRKAGLYVPRPQVTCATCEHFQCDAVNPAQGMGRCAVDAARPHDPPTYPACVRHCGDWCPVSPSTAKHE